MESPREVEQYWEKKAESVGEAILLKSIAQSFFNDPNHRFIREHFGILFSTASILYFEYSTAGRKSILDLVMSRKKGDNLDETLTIPHKRIETACLIATTTARKWIRGNLTPEQVQEMIPKSKSRLWKLLAGSCLLVTSGENLFAFDTPINKEWADFLQRVL